MENINFDANYTNIEEQEVFVDNSNQVITREELEITPLDVIKAHAKQIGQEIVDPTPGCKRCHGRGFTGRDTSNKSPIPCSCIQPNFSSDQSVSMYNRTRTLSRKERRKMDKDMKKRHKRGVL